MPAALHTSPHPAAPERTGHLRVRTLTGCRGPGRLHRAGGFTVPAASPEAAGAADAGAADAGVVAVVEEMAAAGVAADPRPAEEVPSTDRVPRPSAAAVDASAVA